MFKLDVDPSDAHDRFTWMKQEYQDKITACINQWIKDDPFEGLKFYLFVHKRSERDQVRLIWQPRLTKPQAQENSMLFKVDPRKPEEVKIIWMIPVESEFHLYPKGSFFQNQIIAESIDAYLHERKRIEQPDDDDLTDDMVKQVYRHLGYRLPGT